MDKVDVVLIHFIPVHTTLTITYCLLGWRSGVA